MGKRSTVLCLLGDAAALDAGWDGLVRGHRLDVVRCPATATELPRADLVVVAVSAAREAEALELIDLAHRAGHTAVAAVGAEADHRLAVALMRRGAAAYFAIPDDQHRLAAHVAAGVKRRQRAGEHTTLKAFQSSTYAFDAIIGQDAGLLAAVAQAAKVIPSGRATVLITGETGTGKDVLARAIHYCGPRRDAPFVPLNCSAIPSELLESELFGHERGAFTGATAAKPGLLEAAHGGTLFLDEVATLEPNLQAKLLRALETRQVRRVGGLRSIDVEFRVLAATNDDLGELVRQGRFREDLYYRLAVIPIWLPPLRQRGDDVVLIAEHTLAELATSYGVPAPELGDATRDVLRSHSWPGNVRELRNTIERGLLLSEGGLIEPEHLCLTPLPARPLVPGDAKPRLPFPDSLKAIEEAAARAMLEVCGGNKSEAARRLGITRSHLYSLLERHRQQQAAPPTPA